MSFIESLAYTVSKWNRARKYQEFLTVVHPTPDEIILDVGVNAEEYSESDNYLEKNYPYPERITALGTGNLTSFQRRYPAIRTITGDGTRLPFDDNAFDIVYSNAVIEHVGSREGQQRFLRELYRVASRAYITTPNRLFPIETHTRIPLLHLLLSKKHFDRILHAMGKSWATGDYMHLLSETELRTLLAESGIQNMQLRRQHFLGWTLTFTVSWDKTTHHYV